jgi:alginate O-acetyltransferase complex protein AlgI
MPLGFFLLLGLSLLACASLSRRHAWVLVLAASLAFAAFEAGPVVFGVMLAAALGSWMLGQRLARASSPQGRLNFLAAGVALNLAPLIGFKYIALWPALGISYFAFQAIAYLCDIYFEEAQPEPNVCLLLLSLFFFPKFIQGPIERPRLLGPQWQGLGQADGDSLRLGAVLIVWGLFKKMVVAERLGPMVDGVFNALPDHSLAQRLMAAYAFAAQLFCDFSGYTDIALGSALLLGVRLTQNFDGPYAAVSMVDFWRRWHISLSTFIRDYLFQPLQMLFRNAGVWGAAAALFLAFFAMGVWHGATWGYAVFGLIQGALMAGQQLWAAGLKKMNRRWGLPKVILPDWLGWLLTSQTVVFSFVFFRARSLADAWLVLKSAPGGFSQCAHSSGKELFDLVCLGQAPADVLVAWAGVALVSALYFVRKRLAWSRVPTGLRWAAYLALLSAVVLGGRFYAAKQFIYAQF